MAQLWHTLLYQPLVNALIFFYQLLFSNLGLAIIALTAVIRGLLVPLTLPSMKAAKKMRELAPEIEKLKKRHGKDKQAFARAQMDLYKERGANPAAGCLPQIIQLIILIALFQAFRQVLSTDGETIKRLNELLYPPLRLAADTVINARFFYLDLTKPDIFPLPEGFLGGILPGIPGLFLLGAAAIQFLSSKLMMPQAKKAQEVAKKTPEAADDMATAMQTQMIYLFPLMTILIGFSFPSGLVLYWLVFSAFTAAQQYLINQK
jgi:YidC/Oxa1 family membrane protein insertase